MNIIGIIPETSSQYNVPTLAEWRDMHETPETEGWLHLEGLHYPTYVDDYVRAMYHQNERDRVSPALYRRKLKAGRIW